MSPPVLALIAWLLLTVLAASAAVALAKASSRADSDIRRQAAGVRHVGEMVFGQGGILRDASRHARTLGAWQAGVLLGADPRTLLDWEERFGFPAPVDWAADGAVYDRDEIVALHGAMSRSPSIATALREEGAGGRFARRGPSALGPGSEPLPLVVPMLDPLVRSASDPLATWGTGWGPIDPDSE